MSRSMARRPEWSRPTRVLVTLMLALVSTCVLVLTALPANALYLDYTDPAGTGCANNSYVVGTTNIRSPVTGGVIGTVSLKYSTTCGTNWAKVQNNSGYSWIQTWATRPYYDGATTVGHGGDPGPYYGSSAYSTQLYGKSIYVCAYGELLYAPLQGNPTPVRAWFCSA